MNNNKTQLVFISTPGMGNLVPLVEFAHLLTNRDPTRFSATLLILPFPQRPLVNAYAHAQAQHRSTTSTSTSNLHFLHLPPVDPPPAPDTYHSSLAYISLLLQSHIPQIKQSISQLPNVSGLFFDMFTTPLLDVGYQLRIPCYLFFASPASFLGFMLHMPTLDPLLGSHFYESESESGFIEPKDPNTELVVPGFVNKLPPSLLPSVVLKRRVDGYTWFLYHSGRFKEANGIVVNTVEELEPFALHRITQEKELPPVYSVGPVLDLQGPAHWHPDRARYDSIVAWLDGQPDSSVVLLCFGSMGSFSVPQVREIALGLELAGVRFLWSIRDPPKGTLDLPGNYADVEEILPHGFLDRTSEIGLLCGWVPQVTVLAHRAVGGFVSHCGWNSILESLWYGIPIATWPLYAEQQMNAFMLVEELGLAVKIRLDYREDSPLVSAQELAQGVKRLMDANGEVQRKVKEMSECCRMAVMEGGSSYASLGSLMEEINAKHEEVRVS